ncbi:MAG: Dynein regulatory complex protein 11, partial [Marteilia pararefringens]
MEYCTQPQKILILEDQIERIVLRKSELITKFESCSDIQFCRENMRKFELGPKSTPATQRLNNSGDYFKRSKSIEMMEKWNKDVTLMNQEERMKTLKTYDSVVESLLSLQNTIKSIVVRLILNLKARNCRFDIKNMAKDERDEEESATLIQNILRKSLINHNLRLKFVEESQKSQNACRDKIRVDKGLLSTNELIEDLEIHRNKSKEVVRELQQKTADHMYREISHQIGEGLQEEIYQYFIEYRAANGKFPRFPSKSEGGSSIWFNKSKTAAQFKNYLNEGAESDANNVAIQSTTDQAGENSNSLTSLCKEYSMWWEEMDQKDLDCQKMIMDSRNFSQLLVETDEVDRYSVNIDKIRSEKLGMVRRDIREQIDDEMRLVLQDLRSSIDQEKEPKPKKERKGKSLGGAKGRPGNKAIDKKEREFAALKLKEGQEKEVFCTLAQQGLAILPHNEDWPSLKDLISGDLSLSRFEESEENNQIIPFDLIKSYINSQIIIPNSIIEMRKENKEKNDSIEDQRSISSSESYKSIPKSFLFIGPDGIGKNCLIQAIAKDLQAIVLDLSCDKLSVDKFPGKEGMKQLLNLIKQIAINFSPLIILVENVDYLFRKKAVKLPD